jgi:TRAP-type C4-dicarboxylate transport system permease small subunit
MNGFDPNVWLQIIALALVTQGGLLLLSYRWASKAGRSAEPQDWLPPAPVRLVRGIGWACLAIGIGLLVIKFLEILA